MDPVNAPDGPGDQQVMHAQDAMTTPQHAGPVLEGETLGPAYQGPVRADEQPAPVIPNGVPPPVRRTMSDMVEMESLHYSPQASQATPVSDRGAVRQGRAVYAEAWPAQPDPNRDVHQARQPVFSASGFSWVAKLGEFLTDPSARRYGDEDHGDETGDGTWRRGWQYGCTTGAAATHYVTSELADEQTAAASYWDVGSSEAVGRFWTRSRRGPSPIWPRCEKGDGGMDAASAAVIPTASTAGSRN